MNIFEIIGILIVLLLAMVVGSYLLIGLIRYVLIVCAFIKVYCIAGVSIAASYKERSFWKIRLAFRIAFNVPFILSYLLVDGEIYNEYFKIKFSSFVPKVIIFGKSV